MISKLLRLSSFELKRNLIHNKTWLSNSLFLFINMIVFPFTISTNQDSYSVYFLSSVITSTLLAIVLITNNVFDEDVKDGSLNQYIVFGVPFYVIYLSKVIAAIVEFALIICIVLPIMAIFYKVEFELIYQIIILVLLSIPLLSSVSIFGAMLTMNISRSSATAILLIFPLLISALIVLSLATTEIMNGSEFIIAFSYIKINIGLTLLLVPPLAWLSKYLKDL